MSRFVRFSFALQGLIDFKADCGPGYLEPALLQAPNNLIEPIVHHHKGHFSPHPSGPAPVIQEKDIVPETLRLCATGNKFSASADSGIKSALIQAPWFSVRTEWSPLSSSDTAALNPKSEVSRLAESNGWVPRAQ